MLMKKLIILIFFAMMTGISFAQDPLFSQYYAAPLYLNPAFAGTDSSARISFNYRNQWPAILGQFTTYDLEYSQYLEAIHGGFGLMAWKDNAGSGTISTTNISGIYSYLMNVTNDFSLSIGVQGAYMQKNLDWNKLTFNTPVTPGIGFIYTTQEVTPKGESRFFDLSAGIVGYTKEFYFGASVDHITQPSEGFISQGNNLPIKFMGNLGAMIPLNNSSIPIYLSPNIIFIQQQNFQQISMGVYIQRSWLVAGMWYRINDAIITTIGLQRWGMILGYSYDITVNKLSNATGGAHELSLGYRFHSKAKKEGFHSINTPSF